MIAPLANTRKGIKMRPPAYIRVSPIRLLFTGIWSARQDVNVSTRRLYEQVSSFHFFNMTCSYIQYPRTSALFVNVSDHIASSVPDHPNKLVPLALQRMLSPTSPQVKYHHPNISTPVVYVTTKVDDRYTVEVELTPYLSSFVTPPGGSSQLLQLVEPTLSGSTKTSTPQVTIVQGVSSVFPFRIMGSPRLSTDHSAENRYHSRTVSPVVKAHNKYELGVGAS
ncbi:hypothetical protein BDN72DRAFT_881421 [Pluteus cervinus]|uniref:Uncharacterized protein n=1 Tax=Pluteus cervinus TaxID=181527 RepID=A0ACD3AGL5_9AGAR|nr:hypothetical protein BDN72DRAFT_881421 [Pluteus cervinus]